MSQIDVDVIALGRVVDEGRGSLPFALVHGEALVACAAWALGEAGVLPLDARHQHGRRWSTRSAPLVLHDSLCPMTPAGVHRRRAYGARSPSGVVVVGVRPVTDTVKVARTAPSARRSTARRSSRVVSPVVLPAAVVGAPLDGLPGARLRRAGRGAAADGSRSCSLEAPPEARRVAAEDDSGARGAHPRRR